ncbi:condensation domain-containing protein [Amycolatopsis sp. cmx-11-12]|uniref:condensation domain-containing protein n=1 Tax=Amycolatopsis sp. cmx-11-12 TaxID=2785795 RepID=UPI00391731E7
MSTSAEGLNRLPAERRATLLRHLRSRAEHSGRIVRLDGLGPPVPSHQQRQLWLADRLGDGTRRNNVGLALSLRGPLDVDALRRALQSLLVRHDVLRTAFVEVDGELALEPPGNPDLPLPVLDLRDRPGTLARVCRDLAGADLDLSDPLGVWVTLIRIAPREHCLMWVVHHARWDPVSSDILMRDLVELYREATGVPGAGPPPLPVRYSDFAVWQQRRLTGDRLAELTEYWSGLRGAAWCELPVDTPRRQVRPGAGASVAAQLDGDTAAAMRALVERTDTTTFMVTLAAFVAVLNRMTGVTDVVLGTASVSRPGQDLDGVIGCFVNMLVLRADATGDPVFLDLLDRVRASSTAAFNHHELPFEQVLEIVQPPHDGVRPPIFGIEFTAVRAGRQQTGRAGDLTVEVSLVHDGAAKFDLSMMVTEYADRVVIEVEYDSGLYRRETVERLVLRFQRALAAAVRDPGLRISGLPLMDDAEIERLPGPVPGVHGSTVDVRFAAVARENAGRPAVVGETATRDFGWLDTGSIAVANLVCSLGIGRGDVVAVASGRDEWFAVAMLGVLRCGAAVAPVGDERAVDGAVLLLRTPTAQGIPSGDTVVELDDHVLSDYAIGTPRVAVDPDDPALVVAGTVRSHAEIGLAVDSLAATLTVDSADRVLPGKSTVDMLTALLNGAAVVLCEPSPLVLRERRVTVAFLDSVPPRDLPDLRAVMVPASAAIDDRPGLVTRIDLDGMPVLLGKPWALSPVPNRHVVLRDAQRNLVPTGAVGHIWVDGVRLPSPDDEDLSGHWSADGSLVLEGITRLDPSKEDNGADDLAEEIALRLTGMPDLPRLGVDDDFFGSGGTSRQVIQVVAAIKQHYGVKVNLAEFFEQPTVRALARIVYAGGKQAKA